MSTVRPRALVHRGVVDAVGFAFDTSLLGEREARRRVVAFWSPGALVYRTPAALVLRLARPLSVACERAPGAPLRAQGAVLTAAPLGHDELAALAAPAGAAVLLHGGEAHAYALEARALEDPAAWLDVSVFAPLEVSPLGAPPAPARLMDPAPASVRAVFADKVPAPVEELAAARAALRAALEGRLVTDGRRGAARSSRSHWPGVLRALLAALVARVASAFARRRGPARTEVETPARAPAVPPPYRSPGGTPPEEPATSAPVGESRSGGLASTAGVRGSERGRSPGFDELDAADLSGDGSAPNVRRRGRVTHALADLLRALRRTFARAVVASRLGTWIGRKQAEYVADMMDRFERGDLEGALRRAIPLGGESAGPTQPSLRVPSPRADLRIPLGKPAGGAGSTLDVGDSLFERMRVLYRGAFERLDAEGRFDEAGFVLAELLGLTAEAVSYLESRGRLALAAQLAEARGLPAEQVVRLWFLAGDRTRAVRLARRSGRLSEAVWLLARTDPKAADALRVLWAEALGAAGDHLAAVDALWPVVDERPRALPWLQRAIANGGPGGGRALARMLQLFPDADVAHALGALLDDPHPGLAPARAAFADDLFLVPKTARTRALARGVVRALVRDEPRGEDGKAAGRVRALVEYANSGAMRADLPVLGAVLPPRLADRAAPRVLTLDAADTGSARVHDVLLLPSGRVALALGEAGVRILARDGRTAALIDQPAERLVASDHGDRAIALARRGSQHRLARLDLLDARGAYWCDARVTAFAPGYDGALWFVAEDDALLAVDTHADDFAAQWRVNERSARVVAVARDRARVAALLELLPEPGERANPGFRRWSFELPTLLLRESVALSARARGGAITPGGEVLAPAQRTPPALGPALLRPATERRAEAEHPAGERNGSAAGLVLTAEWALLEVALPGAREFVLLDVPTMRERLRVRLEQPGPCAARIHDGVLLVCDARGRVLGVELVHGRTVLDLRV